ncbi:MAG TPA: hypothetical protein VH877_31290 [Polyangia bacterium]|jgi:hypothetical protein|nr:hypothetical protein [Polyangia bacterium]
MSVLLVASLLAAAGVAGGLMSRPRRRGVDYQELLHGSRVPIRKVVAGQPAKISGRVRLTGPPLVAPLTGRRCAGYEVEVREREDAWQRIVAEVAGTDFLVEDPEGGTALVKAEQALLVLAEDGEAAVSGLALADRLIALLQRQGRMREVELQYDLEDLYFVERILAPGKRVSVVGVGGWEPNTDPQAAHSYRAMAERLVLRAQGPGSLLISDDPAVIG